MAIRGRRGKRHTESHEDSPLSVWPHALLPSQPLLLRPPSLHARDIRVPHCGQRLAWPAPSFSTLVSLSLTCAVLTPATFLLLSTPRSFRVGPSVHVTPIPGTIPPLPFPWLGGSIVSHRPPLRAASRGPSSNGGPCPVGPGLSKGFFCSFVFETTLIQTLCILSFFS